MTRRACLGGLASAAGMALCICAAAAADLPAAPRPVTAPVAYAPEAIYNWSGFYIGGHLGGGFANSSWSDPFTGANNSFNGGAGFLGGGQVGANLQLNRLVLGVEGDFSWTGLRGVGLDSLGDRIRTNTNWTSTVTGRVGAAFDRLLVYGKGGVAFAQDQSAFTDLFGNGASSTFLRTGWTVGAGLEYAISKNWSARLEYDYLGFGAQTLNFTTPTTASYTSKAGLNVQEIKAGLDFRFGGP
ncbi:MAG TPA: outer membrane protein [Xanthobacteraceae bacterium]|nr:outer membrane protein [Xanthobacteraceae bacterium]